MEIGDIGKASDQLQPIPRLGTKIGELWSTNQKVTGALLTHTESFLEDCIPALRECCPSNFYMWQRMAKASRGPRTILYNDKFNNWPKFSMCMPITYACKLTKVFHVTCHEAGMIIWVQLFGGLPQRILESKKRRKIWHNFGQL